MLTSLLDCEKDEEEEENFENYERDSSNRNNNESPFFQEESSSAEITIDIQTSDNLSEKLVLSTNDDISEKLDSFCRQHNYSETTKKLIINQISKKVSELTAESKYPEEGEETNDEGELFEENNGDSDDDNDYYIEPQIYQKTEQPPKKKKKIIRSETNYGAYLYKRDMEKKKRKNEFYEQQRKESRIEEEKELTFTPNINKKSRQIISSRSHLQFIRPEDRILEHQKVKERKLIQKRIEKSRDNSMIDYSVETFRPKINKNAKRRNKNNDNVYVSLYNRAKEMKELIRQKSEDLFKKKYPFKPQITKRAQKIKNHETTNDLIKRLYYNKENHNHEIIPLKQEKRNKIKLKGKKNVNYYVESKYDKRILNDKLEIHNNEMCNALEKKQQWLFRTMNVVTKMKILKYKEIFDLLDRDGDGFISHDNMKLSGFDNKMLLAITPIFEEISKKKDTMVTFKEFVDIADRLISNQIFKK